MFPRRLFLPGAVLVVALAVWVVAQTRGAGFRVDQAQVSQSDSIVQAGGGSAAHPASRSAPGTSAGADSIVQERDPGADSIAEILEAQAGQLTDLLSHLRGTCASAKASAGVHVAIGTATRCVEDAEAAMSTVELLRETIASPAGAGMPAEVRRRWDGTLSAATATIHELLGPLWDDAGGALASAHESPADFRALGHLRDRIGRILSAAEHP